MMNHPQPRERYLAARQFLESIGTKSVRHGSRTLDEHLVGTHLMLQVRGEREAVCLGGLFHSIYGTNIFKTATLRGDSKDDRETVAGVIGVEAENLAYLFCTLTDRPQSLLRPRDYTKTVAVARALRDLQAIELANLIEQGGYSAVIRWL
jgi:hypothetical protein